MPHVIVKMYAGRPDEQRRALAEKITAAVTQTLGCGEDAVSVGIEEVVPEDWTETVYKLDILDRPDTIFKKPGYKPS